MVVVMILYFAFIGIVKISYVETVWSCRDSQCLKDPEDGSLRNRPGYHPVNYELETPYVVAFEDKRNKEIFCLGVLIRNDRALTTMVCMYIRAERHKWSTRKEDTFTVLYGNKMVSSMQRIGVQQIRITPRCNNFKITEVFWKACDFAIVRTQYPFANAKTAVFPSTEQETARLLLEKSMRDNRYCIGVGFGKYEVWSGRDHWTPGKRFWLYHREGRSRAELHKFDMRLLRPYSCNEEVVNCCISDKFDRFRYTFFTDYFKRVNCVARGKKFSQCFGESGGPVICDGYVFGLIKGTLECPLEKDKDEKTDIRGYMIYVGINYAMHFIKYDYVPTFNVDTRPVPDVDPFGVPIDSEGRPVDSGSRPVIPSNVTDNDPRTENGTTTGTAEGEDDGDYYDYSNVNRPEILTFISAILTICYNMIFEK